MSRDEVNAARVRGFNAGAKAQADRIKAAIELIYPEHLDKKGRRILRGALLPNLDKRIAVEPEARP